MRAPHRAVAVVRPWLGIELDEVSAKDKLVAAVGGGLGIGAILLVTEHVLGLRGAPMLAASMGASAVLLFAVPHGQLSQPWPVAVGHIGSAAVGVLCAKTIGNIDVAAVCAVGLAIGLMHVLKSIHPPGGATALTAVIGGPAVRSLGFGYVWRPVLLNVLVILVAAVVVNAAFPWRRYPAHLGRRRPPVGAPVPAVAHEDVLAALRAMDSFVDVAEEDLVALIGLLRTAEGEPPPPSGLLAPGG